MGRELEVESRYHINMLHRTRTTRTFGRSLAAMLAFALTCAPSGLRAQNLPELGDSSQSVMSPTQERAIGEQIMGEVRADKDYWDDVELADYVATLGKRLIRANTDARQDFEFFVMRDSTLNAFALPGGFIGVHTGLISAAQSESELAAVLSHEIAHVTQHHIARLVTAGNQSSLTTLAAIAIAILAARSNSEISQAAIAAAQASAIQTQLDFTREHEREADRIGLQTLADAGFDPAAMASFFERLQRYNRVYDSNAPKYLRTHPVTTERIADVENRLSKLPYKQALDSLEFHLVRAKLRAVLAKPKDALKQFEPLGAQASEQAQVAHAYGRSMAYWRLRNYKQAERELAIARKANHPMIENLAGQIQLDQDDFAAAAKTYHAAAQRFPSQRALSYGHARALLMNGDAKQALRLIENRLQVARNDFRLYELQAESYAKLGQRFHQHRAQGEAYARRGNLSAAIEQLQIALRSGEGTFHEISSAEARLKELKAAYQSERKSGAQARQSSN